MHVAASLHRSRLAKRNTRRLQGGASVVEFALLAPLLLMLLMACVEFSLLFFANLTMQYAVGEGVRYAITGQSTLDSSATPQRYVAVMNKIRDSSMGLYGFLNPAVSVNNSTPAANAAAWSPGMFGNPGDVLVVRLDCTWTVLTPLFKPFFDNGQYRFSVAATMRNEAFPS